MREPRPGRKLKPRALKKLAAEHLGFEIQVISTCLVPSPGPLVLPLRGGSCFWQAGEHSPVDDARCALYLYHKHRKVGRPAGPCQPALLILQRPPHLSDTLSLV